MNTRHIIVSNKIHIFRSRKQYFAFLKKTDWPVRLVLLITVTFHNHVVCPQSNFTVAVTRFKWHWITWEKPWRHSTVIHAYLDVLTPELHATLVAVLGCYVIRRYWSYTVVESQSFCQTVQTEVERSINRNISGPSWAYLQFAADIYASLIYANSAPKE